MSLTADILRSYAHPGDTLLRRLGPVYRREARALATLMLGCFLVFLAQAPRLQRQSIETGQELDVMIGGALFGWLFVAPLVFYGIAGVSHFVAKLVGGQGTYSEARMALFWSFLAAAPLWLLWGLVAGLVGPGVGLDVIGIVALGAFVLIWGACLYRVERP
ncbi:YIP1 family protein [Palleronia caenipelagi]|uniref:YIP1 family protein n=1 Tax=Palleronia caenipelagi TaxID=2489174 RepID=A0A547Q302_9RHOB|nr:YIP1 family protein [Palleronia caenipelagi]TRD20753.1 YIP1 family protein [Palleronia caenipelagi]